MSKQYRQKHDPESTEHRLKIDLEVTLRLCLTDGLLTGGFRNSMLARP